MILAEDLKEVEDRKPDFIVLTGDGLWEHRVLRGLVKKFPCNLFLFFPKSPLMRKTGKSVYEAIPVNIEKYRVCKFLVLYDNEHHRNFNQDLTILNNTGIRVLFYEQIIPDRILYVFGKIGSRGVVIYTSVQGLRRAGNRKGINEEIAELIRLRFRVNISDDHRAI